MIGHDDNRLNAIALEAIPEKQSDCRLVRAKKVWKRDQLIKQIKDYTESINNGAT